MPIITDEEMDESNNILVSIILCRVAHKMAPDERDNFLKITKAIKGQHARVVEQICAVAKPYLEPETVELLASSYNRVPMINAHSAQVFHQKVEELTDDIRMINRLDIQQSDERYIKFLENNADHFSNHPAALQGQLKLIAPRRIAELILWQLSAYVLCAPQKQHQRKRIFNTIQPLITHARQVHLTNTPSWWTVFFNDVLHLPKNSSSPDNETEQHLNRVHKMFHQDTEPTSLTKLEKIRHLAGYYSLFLACQSHLPDFSQQTPSNVTKTDTQHDTPSTQHPKPHTVNTRLNTKLFKQHLQRNIMRISTLPFKGNRDKSSAVCEYPYNDPQKEFSRQQKQLSDRIIAALTNINADIDLPPPNAQTSEYLEKKLIELENRITSATKNHPHINANHRHGVCLFAHFSSETKFLHSLTTSPQIKTIDATTLLFEDELHQIIDAISQAHTRLHQLTDRLATQMLSSDTAQKKEINPCASPRSVSNLSQRLTPTPSLNYTSNTFDATKVIEQTDHKSSDPHLTTKVVQQNNHVNASFPHTNTIDKKTMRSVKPIHHPAPKQIKEHLLVMYCPIETVNGVPHLVTLEDAFEGHPILYQILFQELLSRDNQYYKLKKRVRIDDKYILLTDSQLRSIQQLQGYHQPAGRQLSQLILTKKNYAKVLHRMKQWQLPITDYPVIYRLTCSSPTNSPREDIEHKKRQLSSRRPALTSENLARAQSSQNKIKHRTRIYKPNPKKASQSSRGYADIHSPKTRRSNSSLQRINAKTPTEPDSERQMNKMNRANIHQFRHQFHTNPELFIKNGSRTNDTTHSNPNEGATTVSVSTVTRVSSPEPLLKNRDESTRITASNFQFTSDRLEEVTAQLKKIQQEQRTPQLIR